MTRKRTSTPLVSLLVTPLALESSLGLGSCVDASTQAPDDAVDAGESDQTGSSESQDGDATRSPASIALEPPIALDTNTHVLTIQGSTQADVAWVGVATSVGGSVVPWSRVLGPRAALILLFLRAVTGCAPSEQLTRGADAHEVAPVVRPVPTPCPTGADLEVLARRAWKADDGEVAANCVALSGRRETFWYIEGSHVTGNSASLRRALVNALGQTTWSEDAGYHNKSTLEWFVAERKLFAADLDGDGDDELLYVEICCGHGVDSSRRLAVARIRDRRVVAGSRADAISIAFEEIDHDTGEPSARCDGTWRIVRGPDGTRQISVSRTGPQCIPPGETIYRLEGQTLIPVR